MTNELGALLDKMERTANEYTPGLIESSMCFINRDDVRAVVQRLRECEASRVSGANELLDRWRLDHDRQSAHIAQLRDAAEGVLFESGWREAAHDSDVFGEGQAGFPDAYGKLDAALAAIGEVRLTEGPSSHKAGSAK